MDVQDNILDVYPKHQLQSQTAHDWDKTSDSGGRMNWCYDG